MEHAEARVSHRAFVGVSALLFAVSAAVTILWCASMSAMEGMRMPGGWTMSMAWMRMPGQSWPAAATTFLGMWAVMMVAMMMPYLVPALWRYREAAAATGETRRLGLRTTLVGAGYFFVWTSIGLAAYPAGVALAAIQMRHPAIARATPIAAGIVVLIAGALQFTGWKAGRLACCRGSLRSGCVLPPTNTPWRYGLRLGLDCARCCANLMVLLLVLGVMDLGAMALVAVAITLERLAPAGRSVERVLGAVVVGFGLFMLA